MARFASGSLVGGLAATSRFRSCEFPLLLVHVGCYVQYITFPGEIPKRMSDNARDLAPE
jgi:hypothetical protein